MMNKRGHEMVEASIVLPLVILTILSMILLLIYVHQCLDTQTGVHQTLIERALESKDVFKVAKGSDSTTSNIGGAISKVMHRDFSARCYLINEADAIRLGDFIDGD